MLCGYGRWKAALISYTKLSYDLIIPQLIKKVKDFLIHRQPPTRLDRSRYAGAACD